MGHIDLKVTVTTGEGVQSREEGVTDEGSPPLGGVTRT